MIDLPEVAKVLAHVAVLTPFGLVCALGGASLVGGKLTEKTVGLLVEIAIFTGLIAVLGVLAGMLAGGSRHIVVDLGNWVEFHAGGAGETTHADFKFNVKFVFDRLSIPFAVMTYLLCGTIGVFAIKYMHREHGFNRFFSQFSLFLLGMTTASTAGTIETLFTGWELVGLSSAMLIVFFQDRPAPARNALFVWVVYRISDAALLLAAGVMHHLHSHGDFDQLLGNQSWPDGVASISPDEANIIGALLVIAAAGKSALVPFSGWLPRAMEGPTPSSAVFYGALSVHLGAYMLLRVGPLIALSPWLAIAVILLGLSTAAFATLSGRVQTDVKSALSFASLGQVGLIVAEIGAGAFVRWFWYVALAHLVGHAFLRILQFVRAPTLLQDYRNLENAIGTRLDHTHRIQADAGSFRIWLYRAAIDRGWLDALLVGIVVNPFVSLFRRFDRVERRWTDFLTGRESREPVAVAVDPIEELS